MKRYLPFFILPALINPNSAFADTIVQTTLTSNYLANGISLTDDKPALQLNALYEHHSGLYAAGMASNLSIGAEIDINTGYYYKVHDTLGFDIGATYFIYTDNSFDENSTEYYVGCVCLVGSLVVAKGMYKGLEYINYDFRTEYDIRDDYSVGAHYGIFEIKELDAAFSDYYLSLTKKLGSNSISLLYWYSEYTQEARTALSFSKTFNL